MQKLQHPRPAFPPPLVYGRLALPTRYVLAPLAGYTNLPFRRVVRGLGGVGLATTDLIHARALTEGSRKTLQLIETCPEDRPLAVQIFGSDTGAMCEAAQLLEARGVDSVDINMGCPQKRIVAAGAGARMMCRVDETVSLVSRVVEAVSIPVTAKMRLGWDDSQITAPQLARELEQIGVAAVIVHGRTRAQGFSGTVDLAGIRRVVEAVDKLPIVGNGDVRTIPDAARMLSETGCQGIAIGRGALLNPWLFRQLTEWETTGEYAPPGNFDDRLALLRQQFGYLEEQQGTERAIIQFRKTAHWYSKGMQVRAALRHQFQLAKTKPEFEAVLDAISGEGPTTDPRTDQLPDLSVRTPTGPIEHW